ncbi:MAG TPA: carbohydrate ABC transporter permease, partial [bacterium]|nr:carbohydrate ABC transporter permease [bacterium]
MTGGAAAGGGRRPRSAGRVVLYAALVAASTLYLLPFYVLVVTSMKSFADVSLAQMWAPPSGLHFGSFVQAWRGDAEHGL